MGLNGIVGAHVRASSILVFRRSSWSGDEPLKNRLYALNTSGESGAPLSRSRNRLAQLPACSKQRVLDVLSRLFLRAFGRELVARRRDGLALYERPSQSALLDDMRQLVS